jgi:uncharacterized membrane-anchored protein
MPTARIASITMVIAVLLATAGAPALVQAQGTSGASSEQARQSEEEAAWRAGVQSGTRGPADIPLIDQALLKLPAGYFFFPKAEGARILRALGNTVGDQDFVGLIAGTNPGDEWLVATRYIKDGYIKDDEARNWNADELLQNLKDGAEEANKDRVARGFPELEILGWMEKPGYDSASHRLVWSLLSKHKGAPDSAGKGINYNTYALGRDGYFSLNLLTSADRVAGDQVAAHELLAALSYNPGKNYEDFNAATDHIAAYGIAALVGGVVAKKLGLFALVGVFVVKFAKLIGIAALAVGGSIWNFFRRRPRNVSPHIE